LALRRIIGDDDPGIDRDRHIRRDELQPRPRQVPDRPDIISHLGFRGGRPPRHLAVGCPAVIDDTDVRHQHDAPPCCASVATRTGPECRQFFAVICGAVCRC